MEIIKQGSSGGIGSSSSLGPVGSRSILPQLPHHMLTANHYQPSNKLKRLDHGNTVLLSNGDEDSN